MVIGNWYHLELESRCCSRGRQFRSRRGDSRARFRVQLRHVPRHGKDRMQQEGRRHLARDDAHFRGGHHWRRMVQMLEKGHYQFLRVRNLRILTRDK